MFFRGSIAEAMQKSEQLSWPLLLFVATTEESVTVKTIVRDAQLESVALMQLVVVGTPEHAQLQALVADTETPRVHIFAPKRCRATLPPMSLAKEHFTAEKLGEAVDLASEWSEAYVQDLTLRLGKETELIQKEATRYRKLQEYEKAKNAKPLFGKEATPGSVPAATLPAVSSGAGKATSSAAAPITTPPPKTVSDAIPEAKPTSTEHTQSDGSVVVCDGDVCRRVPAAKAKETTPPVATSEQPVAAAAPTAATISVRCQLPDGQHFIVEQLAPEAPLEDLRTAVKERLEHTEFSIYNSYPPKRFTEDNMAQSFKSLGLDRNAAVRIVMNASLTDNNNRPTTAPVNTSTAAAGSSGAAGIIPATAGRLAGLIRGVAGAFVGGGSAPAQQAAAQPQQQQQQSRPQTAGGTSSSRPRFATLSSLAQAEDEEKDDNPRKQNRYFGGTSTEYEGK